MCSDEEGGGGMVLKMSLVFITTFLSVSYSSKHVPLILVSEK